MSADEAQVNASEVAAQLDRTQERVDAATARADEAIAGAKTLEQRWADFQNLFAQMNQALVRNLAASAGVAIDDNTATDEEKASVFGGKTPSAALFWDMVKRGKMKKIVVCCGAGLSTSAGIPDFRSPMTGIYAKMKAEREARGQQGATESIDPDSLPPGMDAVAAGAPTRDGVPDYANPDQVPLPDSPEEAFSIDYFRRNPKPMMQRAASMWPVVASTSGARGKSRLRSSYKPAPGHALIKMLADMGVLLRVFTQNIDGLEHDAGIPSDLIVNAHGDMRTARCWRCKKAYEGAQLEKILPKLRAGEPVECSCEKGKPFTYFSVGYHRAWIRPGIVMFGETLPKRYSERVAEDLKECDGLIVLGTSLQVMPFANIPTRVGPLVPRMLMNREPAGIFEHPSEYRDVVALGELDPLCATAAGLLGVKDRFSGLCKALKDGGTPPPSPAPLRPQRSSPTRAPVKAAAAAQRTPAGSAAVRAAATKAAPVVASRASKSPPAARRRRSVSPKKKS